MARTYRPNASLRDGEGDGEEEQSGEEEAHSKRIRFFVLPYPPISIWCEGV